MHCYTYYKRKILKYLINQYNNMMRRISHSQIWDPSWMTIIPLWIPFMNIQQHNQLRCYYSNQELIDQQEQQKQYNTQFNFEIYHPLMVRFLLIYKSLQQSNVFDRRYYITMQQLQDKLIQVMEQIKGDSSERYWIISNQFTLQTMHLIENQFRLEHHLLVKFILFTQIDPRNEYIKDRSTRHSTQIKINKNYQSIEKQIIYVQSQLRKLVEEINIPIYKGQQELNQQYLFINLSHYPLEVQEQIIQSKYPHCILENFEEDLLLDKTLLNCQKQFLQYDEQIRQNIKKLVVPGSKELDEDYVFSIMENKLQASSFLIVESQAFFNCTSNITKVASFFIRLSQSQMHYQKEYNRMISSSYVGGITQFLATILGYFILRYNQFWKAEKNYPFGVHFIAKQVSGSFKKNTTINYQSQLFEKSRKMILRDMDIQVIMSQLQEIEKIKHVIFNQTQRKVFNYLQKLVVCVREKINQGKAIEKVKEKMLLDQQCLPNPYLKFNKLYESYEELALAEDLDETEKMMDKRLLKLVEPTIQYSFNSLVEMQKLSRQLRYNKKKRVATQVLRLKTHRQGSTHDVEEEIDNNQDIECITLNGQRKEKQNKNQQRCLSENRFKNLNTLFSSTRQLKDVKLNQIRSKQDFIDVEIFSP